MIYNDQCNKTVEHDGHYWNKRGTEQCSGMTLCGEVSHDPHEIPVAVQVWCTGVCLCGLRKETHGLGAHK